MPERVVSEAGKDRDETQEETRGLTRKEREVFQLMGTRNGDQEIDSKILGGV
jgi:hypothetical protein